MAARDYLQEIFALDREVQSLREDNQALRARVGELEGALREIKEQTNQDYGAIKECMKASQSICPEMFLKMLGDSRRIAKQALKGE
jgi:uncharacterized protein YlxW (UPF0749 family)